MTEGKSEAAKDESTASGANTQQTAPVIPSLTEC